MSLLLNPLEYNPVEGEMDRLRIMTTDFNSYSMDEIKAEPHIFIKQEYPQHPIYVKSEVQDYDEVSIMPVHTPPTPPENNTLPVVGSNTKFLSGSSTPQTSIYECCLYVRGQVSMIERVEFFTNPSCPNTVTYTKNYPPFEMTERITHEKEVVIRLFFKTDGNFCPTIRLPVKVDSTKSGYIHGGVEVPVEIPASQNGAKEKEIAKIAKWLEQDKMDDSSPILNQDVKQEPMIFLQSQNTINTAPANTMHFGSNALWKTSSAPASPLSQVTTPIDNTRTRSASSSPTARSQTVLPNPCCRIQHSSFHSYDDNVPSVRLEGEPTFKRRPGPINLISTTPKFTPISVADTRTILHTINTGDRIHTDQINTIGIESLPTITLSEQPQQPQQIFLTSQNVSPKVSQVRIINDAMPTLQSTSLKPEFFVTRTNDDSNTTEITVGPPQSITQDNDHLRNQRSGRKCRKVYGVSNRSMWCTACRWKKACRRFPS